MKYASGRAAGKATLNNMHISFDEIKHLIDIHGEDKIKRALFDAITEVAKNDFMDVCTYCGEPYNKCTCDFIDKCKGCGKFDDECECNIEYEDEVYEDMCYDYEIRNERKK